MLIPSLPPPRPNPRERRRLRIREELVQKALSLFMEQGFDATTVDQIADKADMSTRNFFRYFATKEELLFEWQKVRDREIADAVATRPLSESPLTALREGLLSIMARYQNEEMIKLVRLGRETPALRAYEQQLGQPLEHELAASVATRLNCDPAMDLRPRILAAVTMRLLWVAVDYWLENGCRSDLSEHVNRAFDIVADVESRAC